MGRYIAEGGGAFEAPAPWDLVEELQVFELCAAWLCGRWGIASGREASLRVCELGGEACRVVSVEGLCISYLLNSDGHAASAGGVE